MNLSNTFEKTLILGAYPLLALTVTAYEATAATAIVVIAAVLAWLTMVWLRSVLPKPLRWLVVVAVSGAIALGGGLLAPFLFPLSTAITTRLAVAGITPIVFTGCVTDEQEAKGGIVPTFICFVGVMLVAGLVREALGNGTLFLRQITASGTAIAGIMGTPTGAFLFLGATMIVARLAARRLVANVTAGEAHTLQRGNR